MNRANRGWTVEPHTGLGPIRLGVDREVVRAVLPEDPIPFSRVVATSVPRDDEFREVGVFVYYDDAGRVEAIESYADGTDSAPTFNAMDLNGRPMSVVLQELGDLGIHPDPQTSDGESFTFVDQGFGIYSSTGAVEATIVFRPGYYD